MASEEASGTLFQHAHEDEGGGVGIATSNSQASESVVVWVLEGSSEGARVRWRLGEWGAGVGGR